MKNLYHIYSYYTISCHCIDEILCMISCTQWNSCLSLDAIYKLMDTTSALKSLDGDWLSHVSLIAAAHLSISINSVSEINFLYNRLILYPRQPQFSRKKSINKNQSDTARIVRLPRFFPRINRKITFTVRAIVAKTKKKFGLRCTGRGTSGACNSCFFPDRPAQYREREIYRIRRRIRERAEERRHTEWSVQDIDDK